MPSIAQNNAAAKALKESGKLTPVAENSAPTPPAAPLIPDFPAQPAKYLNSPLPANMWQSPDQQRQFQNGAIPQTRISPLPPNTNPAIGAASASQAIAATKTILSSNKPVILTMPVEFDVETTETNSTENIDVSWSIEPAVTVLRTASSVGGSTYDATKGEAGTSASPLTISNTPNFDDELILSYTINADPALTSPWTKITNGTLHTSLYWQFLSTAALVSIGPTIVGSDWGTILVFLGTNGSNPSQAQPSVSLESTLDFTNVLPAFGFPNTVGNAIVLAIGQYNNLAGPGVAAFAISDTQGNDYKFAGFATDNILGGVAANLYVALNVKAGANQITVLSSVGPPGPPTPGDVSIVAAEFANVTSISSIPFFGPLTPEFIPAIDLAGIGNGGVTGLLPHASIAATAVTPGSYTSANITVQADGTITAAANGGGGGGVSSLNTLTGALNLISSDSSITIAPSGTDIDLTTAGGGGGASGSTGDLQLNNSGSFGTATDIIGGAAINVNSGVLNLTGGIGLTVNGGPLTVLAGASGNIVLRTNGNIQIDSNGSNLLLGTTFSSGISLGGSASTIGFYGATRQAQITITGSRASGAALADLLTQLATIGLFVDGTTP